MGEDRVSPALAAVGGVPAGQVAAVLEAALQSQVLDALAQGNVAASLAAVGNLAVVRVRLRLVALPAL